MKLRRKHSALSTSFTGQEAILALYDKYPDRFHELFTEEELTEAATSPVRFNLTAYQNPQVLIVERQE